MEQRPETPQERAERVRLNNDVRNFQMILAGVRALVSAGFPERTAIELIIAQRRKQGGR